MHSCKCSSTTNNKENKIKTTDKQLHFFPVPYKFLSVSNKLRAHDVTYFRKYYSYSSHWVEPSTIPFVD